MYTKLSKLIVVVGSLAATIVFGLSSHPVLTGIFLVLFVLFAFELMSAPDEIG